MSIAKATLGQALSRPCPPMRFAPLLGFAGCSTLGIFASYVSMESAGKYTYLVLVQDGQ